VSFLVSVFLETGSKNFWCVPFSGAESGLSFFCVANPKSANFAFPKFVISTLFVFKARKILEDQYYAVKKVELPSKTDPSFNKILREVYLWPQLWHSNIVRYYTCWQEEEKVEDEEDEESSAWKESTCVSDSLVFGEKYEPKYEIGTQSSSSEDESTSESSYAENASPKARRKEWSTSSESEEDSPRKKHVRPKGKFYRTTTSEASSSSVVFEGGRKYF
jgi:hypothetical protein